MGCPVGCRQEWGDRLDTGQRRVVPDSRAPVHHRQPVGSPGVTLPLPPQLFLYNRFGQSGIASSIGETGRAFGGVGGRHGEVGVLSLMPGVSSFGARAGCSPSSLTGSLFPSVMLIVCGALVNGPYALITTAVSADLVSGPPPGRQQGSLRGSWSGFCLLVRFPHSPFLPSWPV